MDVYARIAIPFTIVNLFGVYLILYHSKTFLKPLRTQLLMLQIISLCGDFSLQELLRPTAYWPLAMGHMNGPLCTVLQIPPIFALVGCIILTTSVPPAIFQVILYKHQLLQSPGSRMKVEPWKFKSFMIGFYSVSVVGCLSVFALFDLSQGPSRLYQEYPFLDSYIFAPNAVMAYVEDNVLFWIWGTSLVFGTFFEVSFGALIVLSCWYTINNRLSSKTTRKYETKLLFALVFQLIVPLFTYAVPITYSVIVVYNEMWFLQDYTNLSISFSTLHSFLSTLLMIYINRPYRQATKGFVLKFPPVNLFYTFFSGKVKPMTECEVSRTTKVNPTMFRKSVPNIIFERKTTVLRNISVIENWSIKE